MKNKIQNMENIGGKARNLLELQALGFRVPKFIVIPHHQEKIDIEEIMSEFPENTFFAVRSSALVEDGSDFSYAGQFETFLFVKKENLANAIEKVRQSGNSERIQSYQNHAHVETLQCNVCTMQCNVSTVVQKMINADVSGVAFGINLTDGDRKGQVINAVYGLGEGLVSGDLDADTFIIGNERQTTIATKTHQIVFNEDENGGTKKVEVPKDKINQPTLNEDNILQIIGILDTLNRHFKKPQDIEFAIKDGEIYLLQTRPITNLHKMPDQTDVYTLWDNSNIIESYPGVTTPLTFSFISQSYEGAYRLFSEFMGVSEKALHENERIYKNTLGLMNGRVFYNLKSWYQMLALLPGYSINARFMEKMMGVKERFDVPEGTQLSKTAAWWSVLKMAVKMYQRYRSLPRKRKEFMKLLHSTIAEYKAIDLASKSANELMQLYLNFEKKLLNEWKAPLLNDFFAMIWFGLLEKRCKTYKISDNPNIHNDLLCGSSDIISTQPIHRSIELATLIAENEATKTLFLENDEQTIWKTLQKHQLPAFSVVPTEERKAFEEEEKKNTLGQLKRKIDSYIDEFGERCIGELKLETVSYTQDPTQFIAVLKSYVETGISKKSTSNNIEEKLRSNAEKELNDALRFKIFKKRKLKKTLQKARELVSARENLRYERTRAFGIVRAIFTNMGNRLYAENLIDTPRDIFYLTKEEIFAFIEGRSVTQNLRALIALRKSEFEHYKNQEPPSERFPTYGMVYHANNFYSTQKLEAIEGDLKGIGCCPGRVKAKVRVITNPKEVKSLDGDILVTSSTDPGWVTLFPSASGIIVERGSLLSHSAIVSREMGIPCIVSVTGLLKTLKTGDVVEMDGSTGSIKKL